MLYLDYAKQTENGYIMNFFANSVEDLEDISEGKEFVTKNGTNYGVPAPQSVVTITNKDGEKTTYLMGEDGNWIPGVVNPTDYYTKKQTDAKLDEKEDKITDINLAETGTTVTYDLTGGITLNSTARLTSDEKTHDVTMKMKLPIVPGTGISIDKKEDSESIGISIDGDAYVKVGGIKMYTDAGGATGTYAQPGSIQISGTPASILIRDIRDDYGTTIKPYTNPMLGAYLTSSVTVSLPNKSGTLATTDDIPAAGVEVYEISSSGGRIIGDAPIIQFDYNTYNHASIVSDPGIADNRTRLIMPTPVTKTLFGNQSILGSGNIDLYRHHINLVGRPTGDFYIDVISSKNLVVGSLADLKTLLGDTFKISAYGDYDSLPVLYMSESTLFYLKNGSIEIIELSTPKLQYTDTVTTI